MLESIVVTVVMIVGLVILTVMLFISRFLLICHPNEVIVLSGRRRQVADGATVGYRIIRGGRALRIPILEKAARMSLETIPLELSVQNAYSRGGIPLKVEAIANIKIDSSEPAFGNAVERFLNKPQGDIHEIAKDTLEGNLRGVLATLTPEEVNEDRLKFAGSLIDEADSDLKQLGLQLDTLKIQNVSDEAGYLDSIGRRKTAEVISAARKAEAEKTAEAEEAEAAAKQRAEIAKARSDREIRAAQIEAQRDVQTTEAVAQQKIEEERNNLRVKKAELEKTAVIREQEASVAGEKARAQYEQEMEQERIILQQKRLTADVIEPARAKKEAMELEAKGAAAKILEDGHARLQVMAQTIKTYQSANGEGEKVFMLNMLPEIIAQLVETVSKVNIEKVSVIDSGSSNGHGHGVSRFVNQLPAAVLSLTEQIENATGINILSQFQKHELSEQPEKATPKTGRSRKNNQHDTAQPA
ncbi:MAG: flotillin [Deferribacteres bacterium]|nr:flotillin [Deferribacteres bacterium]